MPQILGVLLAFTNIIPGYREAVKAYEKLSKHACEIVKQRQVDIQKGVSHRNDFLTRFFDLKEKNPKFRLDDIETETMIAL